MPDLNKFQANPNNCIINFDSKYKFLNFIFKIEFIFEIFLGFVLNYLWFHIL